MAGSANNRASLAGAPHSRGSVARAPLAHRTLAAGIADRLRQEILDGVHAEGTPLRQDELASAFKVSRIPVREALIQLEGEGLVEILPHRGAVVSGIARNELADVFALRALLEPRALRASVGRLTEADFAALEEVLTRFESAIHAGDRKLWGQLNLEFHSGLYASAAMPRTQSVIAGLLQTSDRYTRLQLASPERWGRAMDEHRQLLALCRAGRGEDAAALLEAHIRAVRADLDAQLAARQG